MEEQIFCGRGFSNAFITSSVEMIRVRCVDMCSSLVFVTFKSM
jgi:hypothetical protein